MPMHRCTEVQKVQKTVQKTLDALPIAVAQYKKELPLCDGGRSMKLKHKTANHQDLAVSALSFLLAEICRMFRAVDKRRVRRYTDIVFKRTNISLFLIDYGQP
ncbi:MAG: hypothetical protein LBL83_10060 [Clostridiales bacterium]|jgi:hypothetical protein|nr:hypothetical protein [Clostridiales bacterium]